MNEFNILDSSHYDSSAKHGLDKLTLRNYETSPGDNLNTSRERHHIEINNEINELNDEIDEIVQHMDLQYDDLDFEYEHVQTGGIEDRFDNQELLRLERWNAQLDDQDDEFSQVQTAGAFNLGTLPPDMIEELQLRVDGRRCELTQPQNQINDNDSRHNDFEGFDDLKFNDS